MPLSASEGPAPQAAVHVLAFGIVAGGSREEAAGVRSMERDCARRSGCRA